MVVVSCDSDQIGLNTSATSDDCRFRAFFALRRFPLERVGGCWSAISVGTDLRRWLVTLNMVVVVVAPPAPDDDGGLKTVDCPKKSISAVCEKLFLVR